MRETAERLKTRYQSQLDLIRGICGAGLGGCENTAEINTANIAERNLTEM